jgi:tRNA threonylcarbamoyladenosine biosynthesis protein TsaB
VIADARRDTWHCVTATAAEILPLQRIASVGLAASNEPLIQPVAFRSWAPAPRATIDFPYDLASLFSAHGAADLFHATTAPDAFQHETPDYKKWSAQTHSAESAPRR